MNYDTAVQAAMDGTQREIFYSAWGEDDPQSSDDGDRSLEGHLDWNGNEVPDFAMQDDMADDAEPAPLNPPTPVDINDLSRRDLTDGELNRLMASEQARWDAQQAAERYQADRRAGAEKIRENAGEAYDLLQAAHAHAQRMQSANAETSMRAAHQFYGDEFEAAYSDLLTLSPNRADHCQIVQSIVAATDPGEALVGWYRQGGALPSRLPGSLAGRQAPYGGPRASRGATMSDEDAFAAAARIDQGSIFDDAFEQPAKYNRNTARRVGQYETDDEHIFASAFDNGFSQLMPRRSELAGR